jgi:hypothetical protein
MARHEAGRRETTLRYDGGELASWYAMCGKRCAVSDVAGPEALLAHQDCPKKTIASLTVAVHTPLPLADIKIVRIAAG